MAGFTVLPILGFGGNGGNLSPLHRRKSNLAENNPAEKLINITSLGYFTRSNDLDTTSRRPTMHQNCQTSKVPKEHCQ